MMIADEKLKDNGTILDCSDSLRMIHAQKGSPLLCGDLDLGLEEGACPDVMSEQDLSKVLAIAYSLTDET